ncbi:MAG: serine/threonine-protein kinase [Acidobacteriota bacterium]|nr:MAG: serine/threonine-protein kinase [Acidobacteriota bacterium]
MERSIGHFEIGDKLGEGGMGEVYRARDTRLGRDVALKLLPEALLTDSQRMLRFEREAQVLASLNHPHIAHIYGIEESGSQKTLVLELVEGPTLAEKIEQGPVPVNEVMRIARQIAEAVEAAHAKGIVHRDLKPANIKLTSDGQVKVLDFGLAKALQTTQETQQDLTQSPTLTMAATQAGIILGTAGYMSPEQAAGLEADHRADIWAFGVILYELLTSNQLFKGDTVSHTLAAVLRDEPDWSSLPEDVPEPVSRLIKRCLNREVRRRLQSIGEARILIEDFLNGRLEPSTGIEAPVEPVSSTRLSWVLPAITALVFLGAGLWLGSFLGVTGSEVPLRKFKVSAEGLQVNRLKAPTLSPDGQSLAYLREGKLWVRRLDQLEAREIPGTENATLAFWSPDASSLGFVKDQKIWKIPVTGGQAAVICESPGPFGTAGGGGCTWSDDGNIYFTTGNSGLYRVAQVGGDPATFIEPDPETELDFHEPSALPDGKGNLMILHRKDLGYDTILLVTSEGERKELLRVENTSLSSPTYSAPGYIVFSRDGQGSGIWAVPFSLSDLETTGEPVLVASNSRFHASSFEGTLVYLQGTLDEEGQLYWVSREGLLGEPIGTPRVNPFFPYLSSDERFLVVSEGTLGRNDIDLWIHDTNRGTVSRLSNEDGSDWMSVFTPDGNSLFFSTFRNGLPVGIFRRNSDGTGESELLLEGAYGPSITRDGQYLLFHKFHDETETLSVMYLDLVSQGEPQAVFDPSDQDSIALVSPTGEFLAYSSNESGKPQVYLKRFPGGQGRWPVSVDSAKYHWWSRDGRELYFANDENQLHAVAVEPGPRLGTPEMLFDAKLLGLDLDDGYDFSSDRKRLVAVRSDPGDVRALTIIQNWAAEFQEAGD